MDIILWIHTLPPQLVCGIVLLVVGIESLGIPLPGELILMSAALLSVQDGIHPLYIWLAGATGAIIGDSIGYAAGRKYGYRLLRQLSKWFPHHINSRSINDAEELFHRHGVKVVFFGRFVALLRIFAGPLSGILKLPYRQFLAANALGGILWSGLVVWSVYFLGMAAEKWLQRFSWIALIIAVSVSLVFTIIIRRRVIASRHRQQTIRRNNKDIKKQ